MLVYYVLSSATFSLLWGIVWTKGNLFNVSIKVTFFLFAGWGFFLALNLMGFIVRKP